MNGESLEFYSNILKSNMPKGLTEEVWCVDNNELTNKNCITDSGSPVILSKEGTARGQYFEQHFIMGQIL